MKIISNFFPINYNSFNIYSFNIYSMKILQQSHDIREPLDYVIKVSREKSGRLLARSRRMMFIRCHNRIQYHHIRGRRYRVCV